MLFLLAFTAYMIALIWHSVDALVLLIGSDQSDIDPDDDDDNIQSLLRTKVAIDVYLLVVVAIHAPIVCL